MKYRTLLLWVGLWGIATSFAYCNQKDLGVARDEVVYMDAGDRYAQWWRNALTLESGTFSKEAITKSFGGTAPTANNREHPPLLKVAFGMSRFVFHDKLGWMDETSAYRLPNAVCFGLLLILVALFTRKHWGTLAAALAVLLTAFTPRLLFHFGLACFDAPVVLMWMGAVFAYHQALLSRKGYVWFIICWGLLLATKHNGIVFPAVVVAHYVFRWWRKGDSWKVLAKAGGLLVGAGVGALLLLMALWPWLWFDTWNHLADWIRFHTHHVHYNFEYLGTNYNRPPFPWHFPLVMFAAVLPLVTFVAGLIGLGTIAGVSANRKAEERGGYPALLLFLSAGAAMGPFLLRTTPIFGAEKHFAVAFVSAAIFAAVGIVYWTRKLAAFVTTENKKNALIGAVCSLAVLAAGAETFSAQPYALSHYTATVGGPSGGANLGMNRQFWGVAAKGVLPILKTLSPGPIYTHDADMGWRRYLKEGKLHKGFVHSGRERQGIRRSDYALVIHEKHFRRHDFLIWEEYKTVSPVFVLTHYGVPIVSLYRRPSQNGSIDKTKE